MPLRFQLAAGARLCSLGHRRAIFVEATQQLFEIDEVTDYVTRALSQPVSFDGVVADLVGEGMEKSAARAHLQRYLRFWSRRGLLRVEFEPSDGSEVVSELVEIGGRLTRISCHDRALMQLIRPMLPPSSSRDGSEFHRYVICKFRNDVCIARPGQDALIVRQREAVPALKGLMTEDVIANLGTHTALHGALLANHSGGMFLCGSPGAGKTTLALALMHAGFNSVADDIALLHDNGAISGVGFASAVKAHSWTLLPQISASLLVHPVHLRLDGKLVRYFPHPPYPDDQSLAVKTIVLLNRRSNGSAKVTSVEPLRTLAKIVSEANNPQRRLSAMQFEGMLAFVAGAQGIELTYSDLEEGARALARFHDGV